MNICRENFIRKLVLVSLVLFSLLSVFFFIVNGDGERTLLCLVTMVLLFVPMATERVFHCRFSLFLYLICMFFAIGPMLGHSWKFYYMLLGWDKLLHTIAGVVFAIMGVYLPQLILGKDWEYPLMTALFALCFSIAVSAVWEFFEYGMDALFSMDMQNDSIVSSIQSYKLGNDLGVLGSIEQIQEISINGQELGLGGYLDLGLIDTMNDMILEGLGAVVYVAFYYLTGCRQQAIRPVGKSEADEWRNNV